MKKGKLYQSGDLLVLCTGKGKKEDYPTFAGVVVKNASRWKVGNHSKTWTKKAFTRVGFSITTYPTMDEKEEMDAALVD